MDLGLIVNFEWPGLERGTSESRVRLVDFNHVPASFSLTVSRRRTFPQPETPIRVRLRLTVKLSQHQRETKTAARQKRAAVDGFVRTSGGCLFFAAGFL